MVHKFFDEKSFVGAIKSETVSNEELATKLHKSFSRTLEDEKYTNLKTFGLLI